MLPALVITLVMFLAGCTRQTSPLTVHLSSPVGAMWGYLTEADRIEVAPKVRGITYAANHQNCEFARAKELGPALPPAQRTTAGECRQLSIEGGADYWIFMLAPLYTFRGWDDFLAVGVNDRELCPKIRDAVIQRARLETQLGLFGECQAIGVRPVP